MACGFAAPQLLRAQFSRDITIYPPVLYSGLNVITITAPAGISRILYGTRAGWTDLTTGIRTSQFRIISGPSFRQCDRKATFVVFVPTMNREVYLNIQAIDCKRNSETFTLNLENAWNVYREDYGTVQVGSISCHTFEVTTSGGDFVIDSLGSPSPDFQIRYTSRRPPLRIPASGIYTYDVCFTARKVGRMRMPIYVFLRRRFPAGGHNSFVVADTAYVNVIPALVARQETPQIKVKPARPRPRTFTAQPPAIIISKAPVKVDTPRVVPRAMVVELRPVEITPPEVKRPAIASGGEPEPTFSTEILTDPTPHRVVIMPTARPIDSGKIFLSNYDVAGWLAGYGVNDQLSLLAGVLYVPRFINHNFVATAGGRYQVYQDGAWRGAVGAQVNFSETDLSSIVLLSPYAVLSLGDDDRRASTTLGYTWRRHMPKEDTIPPFDKQALVLGIGGDYRIGHHWKVAAEAFLLQEASYQPLIVTLRYFDKRFAIDGGLGLDLGLLGGRTGGIRVAPVISGAWVF